MSDDPQNLLTPNAAADRLNIKPGTLATWRCTGRYPLRFVKVGRSVRYRAEDLDSFVEANVQGQTEPAAESA